MPKLSKEEFREKLSRSIRDRKKQKENQTKEDIYAIRNRSFNLIKAKRWSTK